MKMERANQTYEKRAGESLLNEIAEQKKKHFLQLVEQLSRLRDIQYGRDSTDGILKNAKGVLARNLPSNLLRAATIFVDYFHGFPPDWSSFSIPEWVGARKLLPEAERGSLICSNFRDISYLGVGDAVILTQDVPIEGLFAGMAGVVREIQSDSEDEAQNLFLVEFGEPEDCITKRVEVPASIVRTPRPGDLLENFQP